MRGVKAEAFTSGEETGKEFGSDIVTNDEIEERRLFKVNRLLRHGRHGSSLVKILTTGLQLDQFIQVTAAHRCGQFDLLIKLLRDGTQAEYVVITGAGLLKKKKV